jgi:hypothetical protein
MCWVTINRVWFDYWIYWTHRLLFCLRWHCLVTASNSRRFSDLWIHVLTVWRLAHDCHSRQQSPATICRPGASVLPAGWRPISKLWTN